MSEDQFKVGYFIFVGHKGVGFFKAVIAVEQFMDSIEVGKVVAGGMNFSARLERASDRVHERLVKQSVVVMLFLRPRVGIEDVVGVDAFRREQVGGEVIAIDSAESDIFPVESPSLFVDFSDAVEHPVNSQKVDLGEFPRSRQYKSPFDATDIDLERSFWMIEIVSEVGWFNPLFRIYA